MLHLGYPPLLPALLTEDAEPLLRLLREARRRSITTSLDMVVVDPASAAAQLDWRRILRGSCRTSTSPLPASMT